MNSHRFCAISALILAAACGRPLPSPPTTPSPAEPAPSDAPAAQGKGETGRRQPSSGPQPYDSVVTADAKTRTGLFSVHRIDDKLLFEIPRSELDKDQLLVAEIAGNVLGSGFGGQPVSNGVYRWEQREERVYLRGVSYEAIADSTTPEYRAVRSANVNPIVAGFDVEAFGPDSSVVVDVSELFTKPPYELSPGRRIPGNVDKERSWIDRAVPFPDNINVYATLTYAQQPPRVPPATPAQGQRNDNPSNTIVMSWSFHRLPDQPMKPRLCDDRVGYFSVRLTDYTDEGQKVDETCFITRYRLEKKNPEADVSDPVEPIVYYIDPATPEQWIPWFKKGVEDWQVAFEAAGFSNAIVAREAPDDTDWSPEDARYSVIRWLPSTTENAFGPNVHDPRSGEILNAHIQMHQNVQRLLLSWYFTQASAADPSARAFPFPDELMGRLMEYVVAHEVGHTLGFQHNMKASSTYPVDSLRSASFLREWGHTPTLMDYSRFNYLVQPGDDVPTELLVPRIGPYDVWATMWGYKPITEAETAEDERPILDSWARVQDTRPWLRFSTSDSRGSDPGELTEAVGDQDAVKATRWGLANIRREVAYLIPATTKPTEGYDDLDLLYGRLIGQWRNELRHVTNIVGGADSQEKYGSQEGVRFTPVSRSRQKAAVAFLNENAFPTPTFLLVDDILRRIESSGSVARVSAAQRSILEALLGNDRLLRMSEYGHGRRPADTYTPLEILEDVRSGIFSELDTGRSIDVYRRALQRAYVEILVEKLDPVRPSTNRPPPPGPQLDLALSDLRAVARAELNTLLTLLDAAADDATGLTRAHIDDLTAYIADALED